MHLRLQYLFIFFTSKIKGCYGGYLSPRKLVAAQKQIASNNGCVIVSELAHSLERSDDDPLKKWIVTTDSGVRY